MPTRRSREPETPAWFSDRRFKKADLHCHSVYSTFKYFRLANTRDSYNQPEDVYRLAKQRGMDYIRSHPGWFVFVTARRFIYIWTGFWSFDIRYLAEEPLDPPNVFFCTALTVLMLMERLWAISLLLKPACIRPSTSISRAVSGESAGLFELASVATLVKTIDATLAEQNV